MSTLPPYYFLYAEDDPDDQLHFQEIMEQVSPDYNTIICHQGLELMQFLEALQPGDYLPCCIILDMNMPIWDGVRTLTEIKKRPPFRNLPVVMFTTSRAQRDIDLCKSLGAEDFLTKPLSADEMQRCIETFSRYCTTTLQKNERHR